MIMTTDITRLPNAWLDEFDSLTLTIQKRHIYALRYYARMTYGRDFDFEPFIFDLLRQLAKEVDVPITRAALLQNMYENQKEEREELIRQYSEEAEDTPAKADLVDRIRILNSWIAPKL